MAEYFDGAYVYMLRCADGSYYCGSCRKPVEERLAEHQQRVFPAAYTASRLPVALVWSEHFVSITDAIAFERRLKGWSRAKKEALIRGDWHVIVSLAAGRRGDADG
jgi:putative endonuclease